MDLGGNVKSKCRIVHDNKILAINRLGSAGLLKLRILLQQSEAPVNFGGICSKSTEIYSR
jgi:hypothetical protein